MKTHTTGKIDFIHIGVMRSGSTWLELALNENPLLDIRKIDSEINENNFLLEEFKEGVRSGLINEKFIYTPGSAKRIKSKFPDVKIIVVLRDPVKRLISGYFLYKSNHMDDEVGFQDFVSNYEKGKLNVHMGMYKEHLQSFLEEFDRSQLGVFIFDDLEKSPEKFVQNIYRFLGVDNGFVPGIINKKKNQRHPNKAR